MRLNGLLVVGARSGFSDALLATYQDQNAGEEREDGHQRRG
jgi:hypothetical protein